MGRQGLGRKEQAVSSAQGGELVYVVFDGEEEGTETVERKWRPDTERTEVAHGCS